MEPLPALQMPYAQASGETGEQMTPVIIPVPVDSEPERCRYCGKANPIAHSPLTRKDKLQMCCAGIGLVLIIVLVFMFLNWTVDRKYDPNQGQHFVPYVMECLRSFWDTLKDIV